MTKAALVNILRVRDVMTTGVFTLAASTKLDAAARALTFHRITGAPVIDGSRLVGVISKTDLVDPRHKSDATVRDAMTRMIYAVRPNDPAIMAVRLMSEERIHRVVVIGDDSGRICGIVTQMDIIDAVAKGECFEAESPAWSDEPRHSEPGVAISYVDLRDVELTGS